MFMMLALLLVAQELFWLMMLALSACWPKQCPADVHDARPFLLVGQNGFQLMFMMLALLLCLLSAIFYFFDFLQILLLAHIGPSAVAVNVFG